MLVTQEQKRALDLFLAQVERRAYRMALYAVAGRDEALDLVQEAMLRLVRRYADHPAEQWRPLFYRILNNLINDHHRRGRVRHFVRDWFGGEAEKQDDLLHEAPSNDPVQCNAETQVMRQLHVALKGLPLRQRQAFLLRHWEGLDVAQTAVAMGCSEGSVKTHTARATQSLRKVLGEYWP